MDALLPAEVAAKSEAIGVAKARLDALSMFLLAVLAGAFIALGAIFAITVITGASGVLPYGVTKLLAGTVFSVGLILVVVGGAELFTGNNLIVMAWASGKVTTTELLRNWSIVYLGNLGGALGTVLLVYLGEVHTFADGAVGVVALNLAAAKLELGFVQAVALGVLCNALVCLAVWLAFSARTTGGKILAIVPPIAAFVACGFEHSIANLFFVPLGLAILAGAEPGFWAGTGLDPAAFEGLTVGRFALQNLLPVTLGNVIGGGGLVASVYWVIYLRPRSAGGA